MLFVAEGIWNEISKASRIYEHIQETAARFLGLGARNNAGIYEDEALILTARYRCDTTLLSLVLFLIGVMGLVFLTSAEVAAEPIKESFEPDKYVISPGGVNMASGRFQYKNTDLDAKASGLSLVRMSGPPVEAIATGVVAFDDNPMGQFTHNWNIRIRKFVDHTPGVWDERHIEMGDKRYHFRPSSIPYCPITPPIWVDSNLMRWEMCFVDIGGSNNDRVKYYVTGTEFGRIEFDSGIHGYCRDEDIYCAASKMTRPDGTEYTFEYDVVLSRPRLRRVTSNRGFSFVFLYSGAGALAAARPKCAL